MINKHDDFYQQYRKLKEDNNEIAALTLELEGLRRQNDEVE